MKTIVIPDIHQRINNIRTILEKEQEYDEVVFLGDYFDSFFEPPKVASFEDTCEYLKHLITEHPNKDKFVFLLGNHDLQYIYLNNKDSHSSVTTPLNYYCSGFTKNKASKFRKVFFDNGYKDDFFIKNFKLVHQTQGWTLSHAGIHPSHIPYSKDLDFFVNVMAKEAWEKFRHLNHQYNWIMSSAGICRGGLDKIGGIVWHDWRYEFETSSLTGKQIVGHTTIPEPACIGKDTDNECWNLDTEKHYGVLVDGKLLSNPY
jgi:hypothetical protein